MRKEIESLKSEIVYLRQKLQHEKNFNLLTKDFNETDSRE